MGKDKKKKGKGMEKTLAKTEKKLDKNLKKKLKEIGEDDIESILAAFNEEQKQLDQVKEETLLEGKFPSRRGGATFSLLQEKEELILFGGEYFDGHKVHIYNDLYVYNIKKNQWSLIKAPNAPPPRTFHQAVVVSRNGGELWIFGGEFSSPSQSQFYHYNDLWLFSFQTKQWNKIVAPNAPSPRSGHRMILMKKYLVIFGGYYDNLRNCRFYNDTYLFNLETNKWEEIKFSATGLNYAPTPRSACQLSFCNKTNTIVLYGGFSKEKSKKDNEKGVVHSDMFTLSHEIKKNGAVEWFWSKVKQSGFKPTERISFSMVTLHDDCAFFFGGVFDNQNDSHHEDEAESTFFNDIYKLDLASHKWTCLTLRGKKEIKKKAIIQANPDSSINQNEEEENEDEDNLDESESKIEENLDIEQLKIDTTNKISDEPNNAFTVTYETKTIAEDTVVSVVKNQSTPNILLPHPRRSSYIQFHKGTIYLYGGKYEDKDDNEITFNDMYTLNIKKLDEWKLIYEDKDLKLEELKKCADSDSWEEDDDDSDDDSDIEIDAPKIEPNETQEQYFNRNIEFWMNEAESEFPNESKTIVKKMALELCLMFWKNFENESSKGKNPLSATA